MDARKVFAFGLVASGFVFGAACGGKNEAEHPPTTQCPPGQVFDGQMCVTQQVGPTPTTTATTTATTTGTTTAPVPTSSGGPQATPLDPSLAAPAMQALDVLAKQHIPAGAKPVQGMQLAGNFQQGQQLETTLQAQPGKCYTVVAAGLPPIQNVDVELVPGVGIPGMGSAILASDQTTSPEAVVGAKPNCWKWAAPFAGPIKVILRVSAGQGVAAAQVYEK